MSCALPPPSGNGVGLLTRLRHTPLRDLLRGRLTGRLDWQRALEVSGLPPAAQVRVALTVRSTKLWRLEKAQVCDELIAHFADGLEAGESTEDLARNFGDPKRTAKLIRSAKKKLRPLWWHGWKWTLRGIGALVVVYAGLTLWYANDKVTIKVDYLAQLNAVALATPESERAWPMYRKAIMEWPALWEESERNADGESPMNFSAIAEEMGNGDGVRIQPKTPEWTLMERELATHSKELANLRKATATPHLGFVAGLGYAKEDIPYFYHGKYAKYGPQASRREHKVNVTLSPEEAESNATLGVLLYYLGDVKNKVAGVLAADMKQAAAKGDVMAILADAQALFGLARQSEEGPVLIQQLTGVSIRNLAAKQLEQAIRQNPQMFDAATLGKLADMTQRIPPPQMHLEGERMWALDVIQSCYTDNGSGGGHFAAKFDFFSGLAGRTKRNDWRYAATMHVVQPIVALAAASRRDEIEVIEEHFNRLEQEACIPMWQMPRSAAQEAVAHEFFPRTTWGTLRHPLAGICVPILGGCRSSFARAQTTHSALQLGIALHRHKLAHGAFPASLDALVPTYLKELPVDPITGGPLHYRRDAKGQPIVWSVGADRVDDGGLAPVNRNGEADNRKAQNWYTPEEAKAAQRGDWILWPMSDLPVMPEK